MSTTSKDTEAQGPAEVKEQPPTDFPDGGFQAWLVVFGGFCLVFASFGWINCVGVFQAYYQSQLLSNYTPSEVAWIPSMESFNMFFWGAAAGYLTDQFGPRLPIAIGSFLHIFGLMMTSISSTYYQIFLSQGVVSAIGCCFLFYPSVTACSSWFLQHRALAIGIMVAGSSIGGVILPIMVDELINRIGFGWTMRSVAFLLLGLVIIGNLTVKSRLPPMKRKVVLKDFVVPYTEPTFLLLTIGVWFVYLGGFIPFTFIIVQAKAQGMSANLANYLVAILNATSTFGRIIPAHFGDIYGVFNVMIICTGVAALFTVVLWTPSTTMSGQNTNALTIVFIALYGFCSGCFFSIIPAQIARISPDIRKLGVRTGSLYAISATGVLIGSPIGGIIAAGNNGFLGLSLFTGLSLAVGTGFVILSRVKETGWQLLAKL